MDGSRDRRRNPRHGARPNTERGRTDKPSRHGARPRGLEHRFDATPALRRRAIPSTSSTRSASGSSMARPTAMACSPHAASVPARSRSTWPTPATASSPPSATGSRGRRRSRLPLTCRVTWAVAARPCGSRSSRPASAARTSGSPTTRSEAPLSWTCSSPPAPPRHDARGRVRGRPRGDERDRRASSEGRGQEGITWIAERCTTGRCIHARAGLLAAQPWPQNTRGTPPIAQQVIGRRRTSWTAVDIYGTIPAELTDETGD
ncbi:MAG: hypothetical protein JWQ20_813 [Conexibacter sp.]|nr:hypothetical protein [Conexibacter sp.]